MADNSELTHIKHLLNRSEAPKHPLFSFKWVCDSLPYKFDTSYVESLELPFVNIDQQQGWHGAGTFTYYPDFSNISTFSLTLYEDSSASTMRWLQFWKNQVKVLYPSGKGEAAKYGSYNLPKQYKHPMKFSLLATDNTRVMTVTLLGTWPTDTGNLSLDYSQSDRIKYTQTFSCDDQVLEFPNSGSAVFIDKSGINLENKFYTNIPGGILNAFENAFSFF